MFRALIHYRDIVFASVAGFGLLGLGLDTLAPTPRSATALIEFAAGSEPLAFGTYHTDGARVRLEPVHGTRQVSLRVEHPVPEVALMVANRVTRDYVEGRSPWRTADTARDRRVVSRLAELHAESGQVEREQVRVAARLGAMATFLRERSPEWRDFEAPRGRLANRRQQIVRAEANLASAREVYRDRHPRLLALERRVLELNAAAWGDLQRVLVEENASQRRLADREIALRASIVKLEETLDHAPAKDDAQSGRQHATVVSEPSITPWTLGPSGVFSLFSYLTAGLLAGASLAVALESHRDLTEALAGGEA